MYKSMEILACRYADIFKGDDKTANQSEKLVLL